MGAIKVNKEALAALLYAEDGPIGQLVRQKSENSVERARIYANNILHRMPEDSRAGVLDSITYDQQGVEAVIGIEDNGKIENYLADKELRELSILFPAVAWEFVPED